MLTLPGDREVELKSRSPTLSNVSPDISQQRVILLREGEHLVLAPPGCGKTHILTERVRHAHSLGVAYGDMLCLTFTNRAARGMSERIRANISDGDISEIYIGNIHRFCSRFLFENALIPAETSVIDDSDAISIMAQFLGEDEQVLATTNKRRRECFDAVHLAAFMYQIEHSHPKELRVHPDCLTKEDIKSLETICRTQQMPFDPSAMSAIYHDARDYMNIVKDTRYLAADQPALMALLRKMELAHYYYSYKKECRLIDFEDLLLHTYDALAHEGELQPDGSRTAYRHYCWCQVDEVQDLNPLQMRIIDLLMAPGSTSLTFLGDEQQAIFSFMGAKMSTLEQLKERCKGHIYYLGTNHRSPKYLLDVFNAYARKVLGISPELLPTTDIEPTLKGDELMVICSNTQQNEFADVAQHAEKLLSQYPDDTTAVIVLSNNDADLVSQRMTEMSVPHFKVSGTDMFSLPEMKLLEAHLSVFANEHNFIAWARLLKGLHVYERNAAARTFVRQLSDRSLTPLDLMVLPGSSYVMEFARIYEEQEIVVFDTETTGLDTLEDDILQIAAVKMRRGDIVEGSEFSVFMETSREIPAMLGDVVNPIIEERKQHRLLSHAEGLSLFMDYAGPDILLGHNADFDYAVLATNLKRYLPGRQLPSADPTMPPLAPLYLDSLKLVRLLEPQLHQYKLKYLLEVLHLAGENSHLADADVAATCNVVRYCYRRALEEIPAQRKFLAQRQVTDRATDIRRKMLPAYRATYSRLHQRQTPGDAPLLTEEMRKMYSYLTREGVIQPVPNIEYAFRYIARELVDTDARQELISQISSNVLAISTLKESDLCTSNIIDEKIIVTTVHKAKGLEFDNVIIFDAADDRYPGFFTQNKSALIAEDARKFYVAMTRAKKRLAIFLSSTKTGRYNMPIQRDATRFMRSIEHLFEKRYTDHADQSDYKSD